MHKRSLFPIVSALMLFSAGAAQSANPTATITIQQSGFTTWSENVTGLIVVDAQNDFSMKHGAGTTGLYQNGGFVDSVSSVGNYWQWKNDTSGNYWSWHSSETLDGAMPVGASNPWMSVLNLKNVSGHGDPDLTYAFSAINNTSSNQTYTFTVGEAIAPLVTGPNSVYSDLAGALTTKDGNVTISPSGSNIALQKFQLSADNGVTFVNAGVDVGAALSATGTVTYGPYSSPVTAGPVGSWNYVQLVNTFVLTPKDSVSMVGYASITPVPEPDAIAMLLAGMGMMGLMVRRRKS